MGRDGVRWGETGREDKDEPTRDGGARQTRDAASETGREKGPLRWRQKCVRIKTAGAGAGAGPRRLSLYPGRKATAQRMAIGNRAGPRLRLELRARGPPYRMPNGRLGQAAPARCLPRGAAWAGPAGLPSAWLGGPARPSPL